MGGLQQHFPARQASWLACQKYIPLWYYMNFSPVIKIIYTKYTAHLQSKWRQQS